MGHSVQATVVKASTRSFGKYAANITLGRNSKIHQMSTNEELQLRILEEEFKKKKKEIVRKIQNLKTLYIQLKKVYNYEKKQITSAQNSIGYPPILSGTFLFPAPIRKRPSVKVHTSTKPSCTNTHKQVHKSPHF